MKIRIMKTPLQEILAPLSRILTADNHLLIAAKDGLASFTVTTATVQLTMDTRLATVEGDCLCAVDFGKFNAAVEACGAQDLELEINHSLLVLRGNGARMADIPYIADLPARMFSDGLAENVTLPTGFVGFLLQAFKGASKDKASSILQGVHVSSKGMAATDGKQLTHIPLPLSMKGEVILPPSPMYSALRKWRWCSLSHWDEWFAITGIGFELIMKGMAGTYPRYESICPADKSLDIAADIQETAVVRAVEFLKSIPKDNHGFTELMVYPDRLELSDQQGHECTLAATSASTSLPCGIFCDAAYLLQMLSLGHRRVCFSSQTVTPIVTTGGSGKYLFMPLKGRPQPRTPAAAVSAVHPQPQQAIQPKEKQTMQKSPVTLPAAATSAPSPSSAIVPPRTAIPEQNEPLAELAANLNAMREHLDDLNARLAEAGRKIREALVLQRQKERTYQEANRKLERIRMAV